MASDCLVAPGHVLKSAMDMERRGSKRVLSEWERLEPDLTEYVLQALRALYHGLVDAKPFRWTYTGRPLTL